MFDIATRQKFRFDSSKGPLSVEQLWDVPLRSRGDSRFNLNEIAKSISQELRSSSEESFVDSPASPEVKILQTKLSIVKHVIATLLKEEEDRKTAADARAQKQKLLSILESKQDEALKNLSLDELKAKIAAL